MSSAGLKDRDVDYLMNPFGDMIVDAESSKFNFLQESKSAIISLIRFCRFFLYEDDEAVLDNYPQIYECALSLGNINHVNDIISMHRRFAKEVHDFIRVESPLLLFLFDDEKSAEVDAIINSVATLDSMNNILNSFKVGSWNDKFERQLVIAYSLVRYRVLIALGNDLISESELLHFFERKLESILPNRESERVKLKLNQNNGREIKNKILSDCNCPPFTGR